MYVQNAITEMDRLEAELFLGSFITPGDRKADEVSWYVQEAPLGLKLYDIWGTA